MASTFKRLGQSELLPRYIFAESLFARRRVLEVGAVSSTLGQSTRFLSTRGARIVVAADSDIAAVQDAQARLAGPNLRFRAQIFDDFEAGAFDLVIVADLAPYIRAPELLKELVRLVAKNGYLMGGLRNPAGLSLATVVEPDDTDVPPTYGQLLDALAGSFASIEVATQSPVLGYQVAFERGEGLQVDGSLAGHSEAAYYVVLAGHEPVRNFDPTWVQLPPEPLAFTGGKLEDATARARTWQDRSDRLKDVLGKKTDELDRREVDLRETKQQLAAATEAVARLTAQLEANRERPEVLRDREELVSRIARTEADLQVARERATDAEGRVTLARQELEAAQRLQKDAVVEALGTQEQARLERARREEVGTQLEDTRNRLTTSYADIHRLQQEAGGDRVELERSRALVDRLKETIASKEAEIALSKDRELKLADGRTHALQAVENLERSLAELRHQTAEARELASRAEAEKYSVLRAREVEAERVQKLEVDAERATSRAQALEEEVRRNEESLAAAQTELTQAQAAHARLQRDIETLSNSERSWREIAQQLEERLNGTTSNVQQLSEELVQAESARDAEMARARRLEKDLETVITAERTARGQAEAALADTVRQLQETGDDREQLLGRRQELEEALSDLERARRSDLERLEQQANELVALQGRSTELQNDLESLRRQHAEAQSHAEQQERALKGLLDSGDADLAAARARVAALEEEAEASRALLDEASREREQLDGDLQAARGSLKDAGDQLGDRDSRLAELTQAVERLEHERAELAAKLEQARRELDGTKESSEANDRQAQQALAELKQQLEAAEQDAQKANQALGDIRGQRQRAEDRIRELEGALSAGEESSQALKDQLGASLAARDTRIAEMEVALTAREESAAALKRELEGSVAAREARVAELESALETARGELSAAQAQRGELTQALEEARAQLAASEAKLQQVSAQRENESLRHAQDDEARAAAQKALGTQLEARLAEVSRLEGEISTGQQELEHLRAELEESLLAREGEVTLRGKVEQERDALAAEAQRLTETLSVVRGESDFARTRTGEVELSMVQLKDATQRELEATRVEAKRSIDEKHAETEARLQTLRDEHSKVLEEQARAYAKSLEEKGDAAEARLKALKAEQEDQAAAQHLKLKELERERDAVKRDLEAAQKASNEERGKARFERESVEAMLNETRAAAERAQSESRGHQAGKQQLQADLDNLRKELSTLRESLAHAGGETRAMAEARSQLEAEVERMRARLPELDAAVDTATSRVSDLEAEGAAQKGRIASLETSLAEEKRRADTLESERAQGQQTVSSSTAELSQARERLAALEHQALGHKELTQALRAAKERIEGLEGELEALKASTALQEEESQVLMRRAALVEKQLEQANRAAPQTTADVTELRNRLPQLEAELEIARMNARNDVEAATRARRQAEELLLALRVKYGELQHALDSNLEELEATRLELPVVKENLVEMTAENELLEGERQRLAMQLEELERSPRPAAGANERVAHLERELVAGRLAQGQVAAQKKRVEELERRLEALQPAPRTSPTPPPSPSPPPVDLDMEVEDSPATTPAVEVFELDVREDDAEELVLLEEEATDPGSKDPRGS